MKSTRDVTHAIRNDLGQFAATIETPVAIRNQESINLNLDHWDWLEAHGYADVQRCDVFSTPAQPRQRVNWNS